MARTFLIVANPGSGAFAWEILDFIVNFLLQKGIDYQVLYTAKSPDYGLGKQLPVSEKFTDIMVIGGDGTIGAVVNAFKEYRLPVSIIPSGTGNDFIKQLGIPKKLDVALEIALNGKVKFSDCGVCNGRYFINGVGIGFDGKVVELLARENSNRKGRLAYFSTVLKILANFRESELTYSFDRQTLSENIFLMTIANGTTFGGGFKIAPHAKIDDGLLDVCLIKTIKPFKRFLNIVKLTKGDHGKLKEVDLFTVKTINIHESELLVAHMDGDYMGNPPFQISIVPGAVPFRSNSI